MRVTIEFVLGTNLSDAVDDVQDAIAKVRTDLPADLEEPVVSKLTITPGGPIATFAVTSSSMDEEALSWFVDDTVSRAVLGVRGRRPVRAHRRRHPRGARSKSIRCGSPRAGSPPSDVSRALRQVQREASGGRGQLGGAEQGVRTIATVRTAQELATLPIALADGR